MLAFLKKHWFLFGLVLALVLALISPATGRWLNPQNYGSTLTVVLMFFLSGLSLPTEAVMAGLRNWKLHLFIETMCFIVAPLYFWSTSLLWSDCWGAGIRAGLFALASLPMTVSSCVVFTQMVRGNVAGAILNAVFSNMAGILLSPLLLTWLLRESGGSLPAEEALRILKGLGVKVLLPFLAGQVAHQYASAWALKRKKQIGIASTLLILMIVYYAFCKAAGNPQLTALLPRLPAVCVFVAISHLILLGASWGGAYLCGFSRDDRVAALFCGSQKTLALGVPLLTIYFDGQPDILGPALVPILFYHPWQIFVAGALQNTRWLRPPADENK